MDFKPAIPFVSDRQLDQVVTFAKSVDPTQASFEDIETVLSWVGKCLVTPPCLIPNYIIKWLAFVSPARLITCEVLCGGVVANAAHMHQKRLESAIFALVALKDLQASVSQTFENVGPEEQPETQPEPKE